MTAELRSEPLKGRPECLRRHPRPLVMERGVDLRRSLELLSELAGAGVQQAALAFGQAAVECVAQQLMAKVEQPAESGWVEHVLVDELAQRSVERVDGHFHDPGEDLRHEAPPDHRA